MNVWNNIVNTYILIYTYVYSTTTTFRTEYRMVKWDCLTVGALTLFSLFNFGNGNKMYQS